MKLFVVSFLMIISWKLKVSVLCCVLFASRLIRPSGTFLNCFTKNHGFILLKSRKKASPYAGFSSYKPALKKLLKGLTSYLFQTLQPHITQNRLLSPTALIVFTRTQRFIT